MNKFDEEYVRQCTNILTYGKWKLNERTGKNCLFYLGDMGKYDLSTGKFPLLTTKLIYTKQMVAELLGFIRGYDNAKQFRDLGCNFWNENANKSKHWLENSNRKGEDDLGRIYGVQARKWQSSIKKNSNFVHTLNENHNVIFNDPFNENVTYVESIDQLKNVIEKLSKGIDDRRLIVTHWNPGELDKMALAPCHMFYQFGIRDGYLDLCMYQRSADYPLGVPMNIASYALLLRLIAQITGLKAGIFTHFLWNMHIYEDQVELLKEQLTREPFEAPELWINPEIKSLKDLETWVTPNDFRVINYNHHPAIKYLF